MYKRLVRAYREEATQKTATVFIILLLSLSSFPQQSLVRPRLGGRGYTLNKTDVVPAFYGADVHVRMKGPECVKLSSLGRRMGRLAGLWS